MLPSFRWAPRGKEVLPLLWDTSDAPALLLPASHCSEGCAQGQCEQEEQRHDVPPKPLRGGELLPAGNG